LIIKEKQIKKIKEQIQIKLHSMSHCENKTSGCANCGNFSGEGPHFVAYYCPKCVDLLQCIHDHDEKPLEGKCTGCSKPNGVRHYYVLCAECKKDTFAKRTFKGTVCKDGEHSK